MSVRRELHLGDNRAGVVFVVSVHLEVLGRNRISGCRDVHRQEVATFAHGWFQRNVFGVGHEVDCIIAVILKHFLRVIEVVLLLSAFSPLCRLKGLVHGLRNCNLAGHVVVQTGGLVHHLTALDQLLGADLPANLPSSDVEELSAGED